MDTPIRLGDILLGKFCIERVIGQGGMGVVVAARHLELGELYAIKFLLPQALSNREAVERFLREARASARLKGEHVARVHDFGRLDSGTPFMIMEHLVGSDLKQILKAHGPLPLGEIVTLVLQVCEAVAEAHALGIIHRDLKPANLFLTRRAAGTPCIKVLDFGISKQLSEASDLTKSGEIFGSPAYMSPEQMVCVKEVDIRSDIWAIGVVLYELATGTTPFRADTPMETVGRVLQQQPARPSSLRQDLPAWFDLVVDGCLQKLPQNRVQSVEELASVLRRYGGAARMSEGALGSSVMQALIAPAPQSITEPSWGRTGFGLRAPRVAGKVRVVIASLAGLAVIAVATFWLLWPHLTDGDGQRVDGVPLSAAEVKSDTSRNSATRPESSVLSDAEALGTTAAPPDSRTAVNPSPAPSVVIEGGPGPRSGLAQGKDSSAGKSKNPAGTASQPKLKSTPQRAQDPKPSFD